MREAATESRAPVTESRRPGANAGDPARTDEAVEVLDGFSDWHQIGRGGDAIVYRARQDSLGREVAIKVLTVDDDESAVRRFTREVQLMVSLGRQHPNIANVLQIGTSSLGRPCIVMDYYELGSLDQRLSRIGPLSADEVILAGTVIADALSFAHDNGVLHRDVKPQNILILPTTYVLADFGIARLIDSAHTATSDRFSYRHASPQVLDGAPPSESDDVFSLGSTLFHLLDGQPPFTTTSGEPDSALAYIQRVRLGRPRPLTRPALPPELIDVIAKCLRNDPLDRFRTAAQVRNALTALPVDWPGRSAPSSITTNAGPPATAVLGPAATAPPPRTATGWGPARGQVSGTDDLTTMRLGSPRPLTSRERESAPTPRHLSGWAIVVIGVLVGVILAVMVSLWLRPENRALLRPNDPGSAVTPNSSPGTTLSGTIHNPDLAPRSLRVRVSGDIATATWQGAVDPPESYRWAITADAADLPPRYFTSMPTERTARATIDPSWDQVCFVVVGMREGQLGGAQACEPR